ncbi:hypothetical protein L4B25_26195 [Salmonella enterica subsp. diarizonae serovar 16:z10:e,n,x,z15]|uniref:Uncharacterized protein n=1 Tax=Salmonella enterica TaxID=28901 RepID=A0A7U5YQH9_SALER|nr:hypothetical protein [Salmonella enterica]MCH5495790.1 hypothetical protein [Salmonella enterica subsp. diarizonae serovar 16:z10:e,n,x,z15]AXD71518.1 hypothetical protein CHC34_11470 [Salmonella enterica]ECP4386484.1 hypothetical protein [Salmonella enterica]EII9564151.1 hypothetical protein [Salmonella enterica]MCH5506879.1 hypothetical protein [Salmonella enterica subsp. diarizonae serovar 16:z10:e,n,x,z15]
MAIHILDRKSEPVEIIDSCIPQESAIQAAREKVREAAMLGITLTAVNEDGENVFDAAFETFIKFIPHGQRIASRILDRMAHNPAESHMLLSGSPQLPDVISKAIVDYFEKQIAISKEYLSMPEHKRQIVREQLLNIMLTK